MKGDVPESAALVSRRRGLLGWVLNRTSGREPVAAPSTFKPATVVEVDVPSCSDPVADDRPWGGGSGAEFWEYLLGEPYVPPAGVPPLPKGPAPTPMQRAKATVLALVQACRGVDLPSIGPETVDHAVRAGLAGIAVSAGSSLIIDRDEVINRADAAGIFVEGVELELRP